MIDWCSIQNEKEGGGGQRVSSSRFLFYCFFSSFCFVLFFCPVLSCCINFIFNSFVISYSMYFAIIEKKITNKNIYTLVLYSVFGKHKLGSFNYWHNWMNCVYCGIVTAANTLKWENFMFSGSRERVHWERMG